MKKTFFLLSFILLGITLLPAQDYYYKIGIGYGQGIGKHKESNIYVPEIIAGLKLNDYVNLGLGMNFMIGKSIDYISVGTDGSESIHYYKYDDIFSLNDFMSASLLGCVEVNPLSDMNDIYPFLRGSVGYTESLGNGGGLTYEPGVGVVFDLPGHDAFYCMTGMNFQNKKISYSENGSSTSKTEVFKNIFFRVGLLF